MKQILLEGINELISIKDNFINSGIETILLVTGKKSFINSTANELIKPVLQDVNTIRFFDFEKNPKKKDLEKGIQIFKDNNCQAIMAVGGGSVIDMAKLINGYSHFNSKSKLKEGIINNEIGNDLYPFYVLPTTAGSGSESTHFAVVYVDDKKYSVANEKLLPHYVCLIPELTYTLSQYLTAVTGIDAFAQAMESWWSINSTKESINFSKRALKLIWDNLKGAVKDNDPKAKAKMLLASNIAGKAINITKTTAPHALSYGFTTYCDLPHGHAVAMLLPNFIQLHQQVNEQNCNDVRGVEWINNIMLDISNLLEIKLEKLAIEVRRFINECGISIDFKELDISVQLFEKAIGNYSKERLKNNPVKVDIDFITNLYISELNI